MLMNALRAAAAGMLVATGGHVALQQDHTSATLASVRTALTTSQASEQSGQTLNGSFSGTIEELGKWLSDQGVAFAIDPDSVKGRHINVNFKSTPLDEAMRAMGNAMGGHFEKTGSTYAFTSGRWLIGSEGAAPGVTLFGGKMTAAERAKAQAELERSMAEVQKERANMKFEGLSKEQMAKMHEEVAKAMQDMKGMKFEGPSKEEMAKMHEEMAKSMKDMKGMKFEGPSKEEMAKIHEEIAKAMKNMKDMKFEGLSKDEMKKLHEELQKALKDMPKSGFVFEGGTPFVFSGDMKAPDAKRLLEMDMKGAKAYTFAPGKGGLLVAPKAPAVMKLNTENMSKFLKSLTPKQKEIQKSRGYLKISDLSPNQRKMLGIGEVSASADHSWIFPKGSTNSINLKWKSDDGEVSVRSDDKPH